MSIVQVSRAIIHLGDIPLDVFQLLDLTYRLSGTSCEKAVNKGRNNISDFKNSKSPEALQFKGLTFQKGKVKDERTTVNLVPFEFAIAYWTKEALVGNMQAIALLGACAKEALDRRADAAFGVKRTEVAYNDNLTDFIQRWRKVRAETRRSHRYMSRSAISKHHPAHLVHDYITKLIFGDTAAEARLKALVDSDEDPEIGLNHQEDIEQMILLGEVKYKYANKRKGTWQEQVESAVRDVLAGK